MEGWIKGDIHCFVTNENNFLLVRLLSLLNNSMKVWDITYNTDGGVNTFKCLDGNGICTYDSNNLLTDIKILDGNGSILNEVQLEYDPVTKFISSYKKIKYNCDGKTIISSLDPNYTSKSALDANTQIALNSGCYVFNTMNGMFNGCNSLTSLDVSKFDTSKVTDMNNMFYGCNALTTIDVSKWNTSKVTDMGAMFDGCSALTTLDVSKFDTSNVTDMGNMFSNCNALTTLDVSKWDTSKVTDMFAMFEECNSLTTLDVSKWDTSKVTDMGLMFANCYKLTNLDVSKWDTSKVTDMSWMFCGCHKLTTIDISNWDTSKVKYFGSMFNNPNLTAIKGVIDMKSADKTFWNNDRTDILLNKRDVNKKMFENCPKLRGVKIKNPPADFETYSGLNSSQYTIVS